MVFFITKTWSLTGSRIDNKMNNGNYSHGRAPHVYFTHIIIFLSQYSLFSHQTALPARFLSLLLVIK